MCIVLLFLSTVSELLYSHDYFFEKWYESLSKRQFSRRLGKTLSWQHSEQETQMASKQM